jgi:Fic family protein
MFAPSVTAGILKPADIAVYRSGQVSNRQSMHVASTARLGHFAFVDIHPDMDGNGQMGRFLMNLMMGAGGHHCTVVPVSDRNADTAAPEKASVRDDIGPFVDFLARLVEKRLGQWGTSGSIEGLEDYDG